MIFLGSPNKESFSDYIEELAADMADFAGCPYEDPVTAFWNGATLRFLEKLNEMGFKLEYDKC